MYVASERPELAKGICLLNCVGGMNQRGLYKDSWQLVVLWPLVVLFEKLLKQKKVASYVFSKFRCGSCRIWRPAIFALKRLGLFLSVSEMPRFVPLMKKRFAPYLPLPMAADFLTPELHAFAAMDVHR